MLLYRVKQIYKDLPACCQDDSPATLFLSRTKDNFNRPFFKCADKYDQDPCSYFQWADQDPSETILTLKPPRPGYLSQRPLLPPPPPSPAPEPKKKKIEMGFLPPVKRITSITLPPDEEPKQKSKRTRKARKPTHHHHHLRSLCCKKVISKILVHRAHPKKFKALNSC